MAGQGPRQTSRRTLLKHVASGAGLGVGALLAGCRREDDGKVPSPERGRRRRRLRAAFSSAGLDAPWNQLGRQAATLWGELLNVDVEWFDGEFFPPEDVQKLAGMKHYPPESSMVIGTEGALLLPLGSGPLLLPREKFRSVKRPKLPGRNHYHHFVDACLGGEMTESHFVQTGPMTETVLLGTVAIRVPGRVLEWDAARMRIPNAPEAERYLRRTYRKGWEVPGLSGV